MTSMVTRRRIPSSTQTQLATRRGNAGKTTSNATRHLLGESTSRFCAKSSILSSYLVAFSQSRNLSASIYRVDPMQRAKLWGRLHNIASGCNCSMTRCNDDVRAMHDQLSCQSQKGLMFQLNWYAISWRHEHRDVRHLRDLWRLS